MSILDQKRKYKVIRDIRNEYIDILSKVHKSTPITEIEDFVDELMKTNMISEEMVLHNNYTNTLKKTDTIDMMEFIERKKPATVTNATLFDTSVSNPLVDVILGFQQQRKEHKKLMFKYQQTNPDLSAKHNLMQLLTKIQMNAIYGANGESSSILYNLYCAEGVTAKGRTLISLAFMSFEAFLGNNYKFLDFNECIIFIKNCMKDANKISSYRHLLNRDITDTDVYIRLVENFYNKQDIDEKILKRLIRNMSIQEKEKVYYTNNIYEFMNDCGELRNLIDNVSVTAIDFTDGNEPPKECVCDLDSIVNLFMVFCHYDHPFINKEYRLENMKRRIVIVIDTDSNFLLLQPFADYVRENIMDPDSISNRKKKELDISLGSMMIYILNTVIGYTLRQYLISCNVREEHLHRVGMKNEFVFSKVFIAASKNYASVAEFQEGNPQNGKLNISGFAIMKAETNKNLRGPFKEILENDIMRSDEIDVSTIFNKLDVIETMIRDSLTQGETKYLPEMRCKPLDTYANPYSEMQVKAMILWNSVCEEKHLIYEYDTFAVLKTTLHDKNNREELSKSYPEIYSKIEENIFNNPNSNISKMNLGVIGIPVMVESIPEWLRPYIDYDTIVEDSLSPFNQCLRPLNVQVLSKSGKNMATNIITL